MKRYFFASILLIGVSTVVSGQKLDVTRYDVRDGLPQSQITSLLEDELGYLWMGTRGGGLSYFDGTKFKTYTRAEGLLGNLVLCVFKSTQGDIWLGGSRGVSRFNGEHFRNYEFGKRIQKIIQFYDTLYCFDMDYELVKIYKDSVYMSTGNGGEKKTNGVFSSGSSEYYSTNTSCELFLHNKNGEVQINLPEGLKVHSVHFLNGRTVLITNRGAFKLSREGKLELLEGRIKFPVILIEDDLKKVWIKHQTDLISLTFNEGETQADTLKIGANSFTALKDKEGITWIGTNGRGLIKYQPTEFEKIEGIDDFVTSVIKVKDKVWVGTKDNGLYVLQDDHIKKHYDFSKRGSNRVNSVRSDKEGKVWIATDAGLAYVDPSETLNWYSGKDGLSSDSINDIEFDNKNRIWLTFKNGKGIGLLDGKKFTQYALNDSINPDKYYEMVYVPEKDRMYIASENSVVYVNNEKVESLIMPTFRKAAVYSIDRYKEDYLIIGSAAKGIALYNIKTDSVRHYARPDGPSVIYFTGTDQDNYVWLGNEMGIARLSFNEQMDVDEYLHFGKIHGYHNHEASFGSLYLGPKDKYFGLSDGLYKFISPVQVFDQPLHFTKIDLFYGEEQLGKYADSVTTFFQTPFFPTLPSKKNHLTFNFLKVNKLNPEAVTYKYILEGFEDKWAPPTRQNKVTYSNISPGHYVFKVLTRDKNGLWATVPLRYEFSIKPPFYGTTVFIILSIVFLIGLILLVIILRVRYQVRRALALERIRQEENAKLRKEIGRDFHDEMGNQLARIINYVGLTKLNGNNVSIALSKVEESAKDLLTGTKDFTWALDPINDCVSNLFVHAKDFGERFFSDSNVEFRASYNVISEQKLPYGFGRQINLVLKEALTNAYKHSKAQWVDLIFDQSDDKLIFMVVDNGVGINKEETKHSEGGVSNMIYRATKVSGDLSINNCNGKGTSIKLTIGIKQLTV